MISAITGIVKQVTNQQVSLVVGGIVECTLQVPDSNCYCVGDSVTLVTYMHWNAENGPSFYGFNSHYDKRLFMLIISCAGIGPKIGLAALADLGVVSFVEAIHMSDMKTLSSISGVGMRKAEQIVMHLKNKIATLQDYGEYEGKDGNGQKDGGASGGGMPSGMSEKAKMWQTINLTLESLNYSRTEIAQAMQHLKTVSSESLDREFTFDQLLRMALMSLAKQSTYQK